jgi:hypothetical protein
MARTKSQESVQQLNTGMRWTRHATPHRVADARKARLLQLVRRLQSDAVQRV